jgi:hypothetical protein
LTGTTITGLTVMSQPQMVVQTHNVAAKASPMDEAQPVDLAPVKKTNLLPGVTQLKIPAVPMKTATPPRAAAV